MIDPQKFRHDRSQYERPTTPYLCGRGSMWSKPCWQGPNLSGSCGGESECRPAKKGDRWECRRPNRGGGPCKEGPLPDGTCAHVRPPCVPRPSLRRWRGRASLIVALVVLTCIVAFANFSKPSLASIDPGPLSSRHSGFTQHIGCGACHVAHEQTGLAWLSAAFLPQDNTGMCLKCHGFGGRERGAHNTTFSDRAGMEEVECEACHSEHRGKDFDPSTVADVVCTSCHEPEIDSFTTSHPQFDNAYPYNVPNSIYFDHARHLKEYFVDDRWVKAKNRSEEFAMLAQESCTVCHEVETATREVKPLGYEEVCAECHGHQITDRILTLFTPDEVQPLTGLLFALSDSDEDELGDILSSLKEESVDVIAQALSEMDPQATAGPLLSGLSPLSVQLAAVAWENEDEYEPSVETALETTGWEVGEDHGGEQSIHYKPTGHSDPVIRSWIELVTRLARSDPDNEIVAEAFGYFIDPESGPGACAKCHISAISEKRDDAEIQWTYRGSSDRPYTRYSHAPHINLLGPDVSCKTCHDLDESADYATFFGTPDSEPDDFHSNFVSIQKTTCDQCHNEGIVRFDCQLCHTYHRDPGFKVGFQDRSALNE